MAQQIADGDGVVVHGVDHDGSGKYDGDVMSDLDPELPSEATDPAACGELEAAQMNMPQGGTDTGGMEYAGSSPSGPSPWAWVAPASPPTASAARADLRRPPRPAAAARWGPPLLGRDVLEPDVVRRGLPFALDGGTDAGLEGGRRADSGDRRRLTYPRVGLGGGGQLKAPSGDRYDEVAWYDGSPTPGETGPSVLEGHVTGSGNDPSVFFELGYVREGHSIEVDRADGTTATFEVTQVRSTPKADFPRVDVYGATDAPELRIITCGGTYDESAGRHLDNVIVFAELVDD